MSKVLHINCCPRKESRTKRLADALLQKLGDYEELKLYDEKIIPLNEERLEHRTALIEKGNYNDESFKYANQFADADIIVISAPFWDLSFPSILKIYIENIYVTGIVSKYSDNGSPLGLCKGKKLYFVTTAGGPFDERFGYEYIRALALEYFGIKDVALIKAEMLDIDGNDAEKILLDAIDIISL
ncbi:MAG: NAD(P)H-dependent oxidoreductase [Ruminococcus sp.]